MTEETALTPKLEPWNGAIISVYRGGVYNIRPVKFDSYVCCMVTRMSVGTQVVYGYTNIVSRLEVIFGNATNQNAPIQLNIEIPTVVDTNKYMNATTNDIMAAVSILRGKDVRIQFGNYVLDHVLISQSTLTLNPAGMGGTAQITIVCYEQFYLANKLRTNSQYEIARVEIERLDDMSYVDKCLISMDSGATLMNDVHIESFSIVHQENIKIIGKNSEFTVYPRYPTLLNSGILVPHSPAAQSATFTANDEYGYGAEHSIQRVFEALTETIDKRQRIRMMMSAYGTFEVLPTSITTDRDTFHQGRMGLSGIIVSHSAGIAEPADGNEEMRKSSPIISAVQE